MDDGLDDSTDAQLKAQGAEGGAAAVAVDEDLFGDEDLDDDGDGWSDIDEQACGTLPDNAASTPVDNDGDDVCDANDICQGDDASGDTDSDELCNNLDSDDDGDLVNAVGEGAPSDATTATTLSSVPAVPKAPTRVGNTTTSSITVSWIAPDANGASISKYGVQYRKQGDTDWSTHSNAEIGRAHV